MLCCWSHSSKRRSPLPLAPPLRFQVGEIFFTSALPWDDATDPALAMPCVTPRDAAEPALAMPWVTPRSFGRSLDPSSEPKMPLLGGEGEPASEVRLTGEAADGEDGLAITGDA